MGYEAKLEEIATDFYRDLNLDGQDDFDRVKALIQKHFPEQPEATTDAQDLEGQFEELENIVNDEIVREQISELKNITLAHLASAREQGEYGRTIRALRNNVVEAEQKGIEWMHRAEAAERKVEEMRPALRNAAMWLREVTTYPAAMAQIGPVTRDRIDGAIFQA
jgi:hypothetical protein